MSNDRTQCCCSVFTLSYVPSLEVVFQCMPIIVFMCSLHVLTILPCGIWPSFGNPAHKEVQPRRAMLQWALFIKTQNFVSGGLFPVGVQQGWEVISSKPQEVYCNVVPNPVSRIFRVYPSTTGLLPAINISLNRLWVLQLLCFFGDTDISFLSVLLDSMCLQRFSKTNIPPTVPNLRQFSLLKKGKTHLTTVERANG